MTASDRTRAGALAAAAMALGVACSCGRTAGAPDAGDAGRDAGDAGRDGGHRDAGHDAGQDAAVDPGPAGWVRLGGLPAACDIEVATNPEALGNLREVSCGPGCRELEPVWPREGLPYFMVALGVGGHDGTTGHFTATHGISDGRAVDFISDDRGRVVAAWRSLVTPDDCYVGAHTRALGTIGFTVNAPVGPRRSLVLFRLESEAPDAARVLHTFTSDELGANGLQRLLSQPGRVAVDMQPGGRVYSLALDGTTRLVAGGGSSGEIAFLDALSGSALFYTLWGVDHHIGVSVGGAPGTVLIDPAGADADMLRTDGVDLYWQQGYGRITDGRFERIEIWTSPYATDPAGLRPRRIALAPDGLLDPRFRASFGYAAWNMITGQIAVFRASDGLRAVVTPPDGTVPSHGGLLYVGPEELAFGSGPLRSFPPETTHVRFVRYDAMTWE